MYLLQERITALEEQRASQRELIAVQAEQIAAQLEQLTAQQERIVAQQTCLEQQRQLIIAQEAWIAGARQRERMGAKRWERNAALVREQRLIQERENWEERRAEEMLAVALFREVAAESCGTEELASTNVGERNMRRPTEFPADLLPIIVQFHPNPVWKRMAAPLKRTKKRARPPSPPPSWMWAGQPPALGSIGSGEPSCMTRCHSW